MHKYERKFRLWPNNQKQTERHPDLSGDVVINGVTYWLNGWKNNDGSITGSIGKPKNPTYGIDAAREDPQEEPKPQQSFQDDLDDTVLPF